MKNKKTKLSELKVKSFKTLRGSDTKKLAGGKSTKLNTSTLQGCDNFTAPAGTC